MAISQIIAMFIISVIMLSPIVFTAYIIWQSPDIEDED